VWSFSLQTREIQPSFRSEFLPITQLITNVTTDNPSQGSSSKVNIEVAFKNGIKYRSPGPLLGTSGKNWVFQPHPELYDILADKVLEQYSHYKENEIDKAYIPNYFYLGGAGTGKSRHASEFAFSVQEAIKLRTQHHLYFDLAQRLKTPFVFHVSFEGRTPLAAGEKSDPWNAIGIRMLEQLLGQDINNIRDQYVAEPSTVFQLVAAAENVDLYDDFTGILVIEGIQKVLTDDDGRNRFLGGLSLMRRSPKEGAKIAPFIMTCVTTSCFGEFLADSHVHLPLNQLQPPTWKKDNSPVFNNSAITRLLINDVGGHGRALELIADELAKYQNGLEPNTSELVNAIYTKLSNRYAEALYMLQNHTLPIVRCILSRQQIRLQDMVPGSDLQWEYVTAAGLIWFERSSTNYGYGYLVAPYIWLWMLGRTPAIEKTKSLCRFLRSWQFNDYEKLLHLAAGKEERYTTWQSFEAFCCSFRILRSLGFGDGEEVPLKLLHSGCKLRDDQKTMVVNRHFQALYQRRTNLRLVKVDNETMNGDDVFCIILNNKTTSFSFSIEIPQDGQVINEVGQCKLIQKDLTQATYATERNKSAGCDDIFMLYTKTGTHDCVLPDRSGLVDASCWDSYFGPFSSRAYIALKHSSSGGME
jgi:hypothetical protein